MNCSDAGYVQIDRVEGWLKFLQLFEQLPCSLLIDIAFEHDGRAPAFGLDRHLKLFEINDVHWTKRARWILDEHERVSSIIPFGLP